MDAQTYAAVCFRAADLIEFGGHARGTAFTKNDDGVIDGYCAIGALSRAFDDVTGSLAVWTHDRTVDTALSREVGGDITGWSDASPTGTVVNVFRRLGKDFANGEVSL